MHECLSESVSVRLVHVPVVWWFHCEHVLAWARTTSCLQAAFGCWTGYTCSPPHTHTRTSAALGSHRSAPDWRKWDSCRHRRVMPTCASLLAIRAGARAVLGGGQVPALRQACTLVPAYASCRNAAVCPWLWLCAGRMAGAGTSTVCSWRTCGNWATCSRRTMWTSVTPSTRCTIRSTSARRARRGASVPSGMPATAVCGCVDGV
jgi:hypothetical protein